MTEFRAIYSQNKSRIIEWILKSYSATGAVLALISGGYFIIRKLNIVLDERDQLTLAVFAFSVSLITLSKLMLEFYREREALRKSRLEREIERYRLLKLWSAFEAVASAHFGEDISDRPVPTRSLIYRLIETGAVTIVQAEALEQALDIRNAVAHGREDALPSELVTQAATALEEILQTLQKLHPKARQSTLA